MPQHPSPLKRRRGPSPAHLRSRTAAHSASGPAEENDSELEPLLDPLESAIENERSRLCRARAVLGCLRVALLYSDEGGEDCDAGEFADAASVAQALVGEAVERLDSVSLAPLMKSKGRRS